MAKRLSRAKRLDMAVGELSDIRSALEEEREDEKTPETERIKFANETLDKLNTSEIDSLREEIDEWKSKLEGTNLENSQKFSDLQECHDALEQIVSDLECIPTSIESLDELEEIIEALDNVEGEAGSVYFPGMFG